MPVRRDLKAPSAGPYFARFACAKGQESGGASALHPTLRKSAKDGAPEILGLGKIGHRDFRLVNGAPHTFSPRL